MSNNYITRCHRQIELVGVRGRQSSVRGSEFQSLLEIRCRSESQRQTEGLGHQDPGWAAQQNEKEVLLLSEELGVNMLQSLFPLQLTSHTQLFRNPFENKVWEVYFSKEVCAFVIIFDYCYGDISDHTPKMDSSNLNIFSELAHSEKTTSRFLRDIWQTDCKLRTASTSFVWLPFFC